MVEEVEKLTVDSWQMTGKEKLTVREKLTDNSWLKTDTAPTNKQQTTTNKQPSTVLIHCWRGGMRSAGVAWLLDLYGLKVYTLAGGYKAYRNWVMRQFEKKYRFNILGGYTGSGKTYILQQMKKNGATIINLEGIANHKGSAFGAIGQPPQPSQEMFENLLAADLAKSFKDDSWLMTDDSKNKENDSLQTTADSYYPLTVNTSSRANDQPSTINNSSLASSIWLEDESQRIGNNNIPAALWKQMRMQPVYFLDIPFEQRLDHIVEGYGKGDQEQILNAIVRIKKRLGGLETKTAINHLLEDNLKECFRILLHYYDKWYKKGLSSRDNFASRIMEVTANEVSHQANAQLILNKFQQQIHE